MLPPLPQDASWLPLTAPLHRHCSVGGVSGRTARQESRKDNQPYQEEDAGSVSSLRLAREHPRTTECSRACGDLVRRRDVLGRRDMAAAKIEPTVRGDWFPVPASWPRTRKSSPRVNVSQSH